VVIGNTVSAKGIEIIEDLTVFPNPTNGLVHLPYEINNNAKVTILDINGKIIVPKLVADGRVLDISNFPNQLYLMKIEHENRLFFTKILKID
jgi:hypothetical protein